MNVRKAARTTTSLLILIIGFYFISLLIRQEFPEEYYILNERFYSLSYFNGYYFLVNVSFSIIVFAGIIDAILNNKVAFHLLSSLNIPILLGIPVVILAFIQPINQNLFLCILQIAAIVGLYSIYRKVIWNNYKKDKKMITFIKDIITSKVHPAGNACDYYAVFSTSLLIILFNAIMLVSIFVYVITYWNSFV